MCAQTAFATHVEPLEGGSGQDGWKCYCGANNGPFGGPGETWTCSLAPSERTTASARCETCCSSASRSIISGTPWNPAHDTFSKFANTVIGYLDFIDWPAPAHVPTYAWTGWFNVDAPGGVGDFEGLSACPNPVDIECRTSDANNLDWRDTGLVYRCSTRQGGACINAEQLPGVPCLNFKVRFACPSNTGIRP